MQRNDVRGESGVAAPGRLVRREVVVLCLAFMVGAASVASAISKSVTDVDLVQYAGYEGSVMVWFLNFTPYTITYASSSMDNTESLITNRDRDQKKSFMFAPVGVPANIPPIGTETVRDEAGQPLYLEPHAQANYHPYPFVISWNNRDGMAEETSIAWTVNDVCYPSIGTDPARCSDKQDVTLGMWFVRQNPKPELKSAFFAAIKAITTLVFETAALVESGGASAIPWVTEFLATEELGQGVTEFAIEQTAEDYGPRMYVSAIPLPASGSDCSIGIGPGCMPGFSNLTCDPDALPDDGVAVQWDTSDGGKHPSRLRVTTQLLRGNWERDPYLGRMPIVLVMVWDPDWYLDAHSAWRLENPCQTTAGVSKIQAHLRHGGRRALLQLSRLIHSLGPREREVFDAALRGLGSKHPLTTAQKEFLDHFAHAFERNETSLKLSNPPREGGHHAG